ncbi:MAG: hypothetical protein IKR25_05960 [Muribaculaceae bacterium]|nr:hypothetical protein [Muribaculaceae bacterium]
MRRIIPILLLLVVCPGLHAVTRYATIHNRFGSLCALTTQRVSCGVEGERYVVDNPTLQPSLVADTCRLPAARFRVQLRVANSHNNPRRRYSVCGDDGTRHHVENPQWGIFLAPGGDTTACWMLTAQCANSHLNDELTDERSMTVVLEQHSPHGTTMLASSRVTSGVDLYDGLNTFQLELRDGTLTAWVGREELQQLFAVPLAITADHVVAGPFAGPGARVEVERCVVAHEQAVQFEPTTAWTVETLDAHFAESNDPVEGYWRYQDRDLDDSCLRLGGRYTLAVVRQGNGYELIYIDGAETHRSQWHTGMLKGRLSTTIFADHYDLLWVDATGDPITHDAYATVENGVLLTLKFPVFSSQIRLAKVLF